MTVTTRMRCAVCNQPLAHYQNGFISRYRHPDVAGQGTKRDHDAQPIPAEEGEADYTLCDFCHTPEVAWLYTTSEEITNTGPRLAASGETYEDHFAKGFMTIRSEKERIGTVSINNSAYWTACKLCAALVEKQDIYRLITRIKHTAPHGPRSTRTALAALLAPFFATRLPDRQAIEKKETA